MADGYTITLAQTEPKTVTLAGKSEILNLVEYVEVSNVDVSRLKNDTIKNTTLKIPNGLIIVDGNDSVEVSLTIETIETMVIGVSTISFENLPANLKSQVEGTPIMVEISGAKSFLAEPGLSASVDLTGLTEGRHQLPLNIKTKAGVSTTSNHSIWVEITK